MSSVPSLSKGLYPVKSALAVGADREIEEALSEALDQREWAIHHAPDNSAALALVERKAFDLIVTGEKTSGKEDVELLRKIRRLRPHTRVIVLTDESTPADVIASMRERAFSYFSKPFSNDALKEMIHQAAEAPCWDDGIEIISATPEWIRLLAACDLTTAGRLVQFIDEMGNLQEPEKTAVATAFREILMNAIEYGGGLDPEQYVEISYIRGQQAIGCRITDPGKGFQTSKIPHAAVSNPPGSPLQHHQLRESQGIRPGGFGILLARQMLDQVIYSESGNEVLLVKYLNTTPTS
jgi:CheY-like chemotaxis protein/anti-sigma regulatory factor (Ser/Thr protein kinase)